MDGQNRSLLAAPVAVRVVNDFLGRELMKGVLPIRSEHTFGVDNASGDQESYGDGEDRPGL